MVRLIVDDAGNRRAFNVGEGRLSVGSGAEAKLKLTSGGVAGLHADIEVHGGKATLHPKPGVTAPQVLGRAAIGPVVLQHGVPVKLGGATITVEYEGLPSKVNPVATAPTPVVRSDARTKRRGPEAEKEAREPRQRARKQGLPTWAWIAGGLPLVILLGYFLSTKLLGKNTLNIGAASALANYNKALDEYKNSRFDAATKQLNLTPDDAAIDPNLAAQIEKLRADIKTKTIEGEEYSRNEMAGKNYFGTQLEGFAKDRMSGKITSEAARVFMKRARYFREKWPTHPDLPWVTRQEERFKSAVDLTKPASFADIAFEVDSLTWSLPRNYKEAFAVARAFQTSASGEDVAKIEAFLKELEGKRSAWFQDRLEQARFHFDRKEEGKSIGVLLSVIRYAGDDSMADDAATRLLKYGDMETWMRGYRSNDPEGYAEVSKNRVIAGFLREHKL